MNTLNVLKIVCSKLNLAATSKYARFDRITVSVLISLYISKLISEKTYVPKNWFEVYFTLEILRRLCAYFSRNFAFRHSFLFPVYTSTHCRHTNVVVVACIVVNTPQRIFECKVHRFLFQRNTTQRRWDDESFRSISSLLWNVYEWQKK